jgi:hypothetical protein
MQQQADEYVRTHDLQAQLIAVLRDQGKDRWTIADPSPDVATVRVGLEKIALYGLRDGRVGLLLHTKIVIRPPGGSRSDEEESTFRSVGAADDAKLWQENRDGLVADNFRRAGEGAASFIVAHLLNSRPYLSPYKRYRSETP